MGENLVFGCLSLSYGFGCRTLAGLTTFVYGQATGDDKETKAGHGQKRKLSQ